MKILKIGNLNFNLNNNTLKKCDDDIYLQKIKQYKI